MSPVFVRVSLRFLILFGTASVVVVMAASCVDAPFLPFIGEAEGKTSCTGIRSRSAEDSTSKVIKAGLPGGI